MDFSSYCTSYYSNQYLRDDSHMTSMKIVQFLRPPTLLVHLRRKFFHTLDLGRPVLNEPSPSPNDNQSIKRKHNTRMTIICYLVLPSGRPSFEFFHLAKAASTFSLLYNLVFAVVQKYYEMSFIYNYSHF